MGGKLPVVIEENWEVYSYHSEDKPVFVSFYAEVNKIPRNEFPFCARVLIPIKQPNENGGPNDDEAKLLWTLEDTLTEQLSRQGAECIMLARLTHIGIRELVFQLADWNKFRPPVGQWMSKNRDYAIDVSEQEGWEFFDECVWPSDEDWLFIQDRKVVDQLIQSGSNPKKVHSLEFVFLGSQERLQKLKSELTARGYDELESSTTSSGQLVMVKKLPLDQQIYSESLENLRLCNEMEIKFDGWGAAIVK